MTEKASTKSRRWPTNVGVNMGRVRFRKSIPTELALTSGKKHFQEYLPVEVSATFEEAFEAAKPAKARYDAYIKSLRNSSIDAFTENELESLAASFLKKAKVNVGDIALHKVGPEFIKRHGLEGIQESLGRKLNTADLQLLFFPSIANVVARNEEEILKFQEFRKQLGLKGNGLFSDTLKPAPTIQELAQFRAAEAAANIQSKQPKTLTWWWNDYLVFRGLTDPEDRNTKRIQRYWDRFLLSVGDHVVTPDSQQIIDDALEEQVQTRLREKQVTVSTIKRELSEVLAALNRMANKQRPRWPKFIVPETPYYEEKDREPLTVEDQITLVKHCLSNSDDWVSAVHLLELQGGMMAQEIRTLDPEDLHLGGNYPHIVIRRGKTVARPRIVPIILGHEVIKKNILTAIMRLDVKDPSATPRNRIKRLFNGRYTSHGLRHTIRLNGTANDVSHLALQTISGWSEGKINKHMLRYGKAGLADSSEVIKATFLASLQIHQHLMHLQDPSPAAANLVHLKR